MSARRPGQSSAPNPRGAVDEALGWMRAFGLGVRDTAKDMLEAGRREAREAYGEGWDRFDQKTKKGRYRRKKDA